MAQPFIHRADTIDMQLTNDYTRLPGACYAPTSPARVPEPRILAWNDELAAALGLQALADDREQLAAMFAGNALPPGAAPVALAYAGHQFGYFVPQLGDGRALLLGDVTAADGTRYDIQMKGSGRTPFSRGGDGKSWLGPVLREYVVSEAMHWLGVPTTRALAAVSTGETVLRELPLPGAVLTRVATSHIRVGSFQYFAAQGDADAIRQLADYAIERHYPSAAAVESPYVALFAAVCRAQAELISHWMAVGFIHGVMNTDNTAISGETIDYGPCAFMDEFRRDKVFSSIDRGGRYAYHRQWLIGQWNLARLAECLLMICDDQSAFEAALDDYETHYQTRYRERLGAKLGLRAATPDDDALIAAWFDHIEQRGLDFTLSFRALAERVGATAAPQFGEFETRWQARLAQLGDDAAAVRGRMNAANPVYIPRNHQVERAIAAALDGDLSVFRTLLDAVNRPCDERPELAEFALAPTPEQRVSQTFCGT